ncbi:MAG: hypothetical protein EHM51_01710 [Geobacter sp.]|nr:MAG: hypothetical protein EHM51_01710 [Geobacter sp.]
MKKSILTALTLLVFCVQAFAGGGLDGFLNSLNIQAQADQNGFSGRLSAQFGVPQARVQVILGSVQQPADAFMCLQLGQMTQKPAGTVLKVYQSHKGKGWGVIAKELGIKPGSSEFHALKRGDFQLSGDTPVEHGKGKGKGKGHGRGHGA